MVTLEEEEEEKKKHTGKHFTPKQRVTHTPQVFVKLLGAGTDLPVLDPG